MLRTNIKKSQPDFQRYVEKIEAQAKKWFSYEKKVYAKMTLSLAGVSYQ